MRRRFLFASMFNLDFFKGSRLFVYLGFGLVFLALFCLPAKVRVVHGIDVDVMYIGPIFALLIVAWSFPSFALGVVESFTSKKAVLAGFTPTLSLANIVLASIIWQYVTFSYTDIASLLPFFVPCVIADIIGLCYFVKGREAANTLKNPKIRMPIVIALVAFPVLVVAGNLLQGIIFY